MADETKASFAVELKDDTSPAANDAAGWSGIAFGANGLLYVSGYSAFFSWLPGLWTVNPSTGATTKISNTSFAGLTFYDGLLYGTQGPSIYQINATRGAATQIWTDSNNNTLGNMEAGNDGFLYFIDNGVAAKINPYTSGATGNMTSPSYDNNNAAVRTLAFDPNYPGYLYSPSYYKFFSGTDATIPAGSQPQVGRSGVVGSPAVTGTDGVVYGPDGYLYVIEKLDSNNNYALYKAVP